MPEVSFNCPLCGQPLDAPQEMAGQSIDCPSCKQSIRIPAPPSWGRRGTRDYGPVTARLPTRHKTQRLRTRYITEPADGPAYLPGQAPVSQVVILKDVDIPFGSLMMFMLKWAFAAMPALLMLLGLALLLVRIGRLLAFTPVP